MFSTGFRAGVVARHALPGVSGPEALEHTHPYEIEWICSSSGLDADGYAIDISLMREILLDELAQVNDRFLNDLEFFQERQPSLENFAVYLFQRFHDRIRGSRARVLPVRMQVLIHESADAWASYEGSFSSDGDEC